MGPKQLPTYADTNSDSLSYADADEYTNSSSNADGYSDIHTDAHRDAAGHNPDRNTDSHAVSGSNEDPRCHSHEHDRACHTCADASIAFEIWLVTRS